MTTRLTISMASQRFVGISTRFPCRTACAQKTVPQNSVPEPDFGLGSRTFSKEPKEPEPRFLRMRRKGAVGPRPAVPVAGARTAGSRWNRLLYCRPPPPTTPAPPRAAANALRRRCASTRGYSHGAMGRQAKEEGSSQIPKQPTTQSSCGVASSGMW